ncbi:MAG: hypothetical protein Q7R79_04765 [bacterium]|nr:hypothetical protein [bacterium]
MSESGDFSPGYWTGHDFSSARKSYDVHAGRSYADAKAVGKKTKDLVPQTIQTESDKPLTILCDVTGSMSEWPGVIFSKLPYLELEGQEYLGKDMEICLGAIGDAYGDTYPLQVRPFTKGLGLKDRLKELVIEKGGGGTKQESYELAAYYFLHNVQMPKAVIKPLLLFIGDEAPYDFVNEEHVRNHAYGSLQEKLSTAALFKTLMEKFSVYLIRKPYNTTRNNTMSAEDTKIYKAWRDLIGADRIADLPEAGRVVDVIFGILARETGRVPYFRKELEGRQEPVQVEAVYKSLATIHAVSGSDAKLALPPGKSRLHRGDDGPATKPLL